MMPVTRVSKNIGLISSDMTVSKFAQIPNWFLTKSVSTAGVVFTQRVHPCIYNNSTTGGRGMNPDFLGFAAAGFTFWRGSIKFLFHFCGTAFYSGTFRITLYHGLSVSKISELAAIEDGVGCYSRVVTVRGDAWVEFQVPFLHNKAWQYTNTLLFINEQITDPFLMLEALTDVQGSNSPSGALYYINVFRAGGEDIEFAQLGRSLWTDPPSSFVEERVWKSQCSLVDKFAKPFDPIIPGVVGTIEDNVCMGDKAGTITDICKRFVRQFNGNQTGNVGRAYQTFPLNQDSVMTLQPLFWWGWAFCYWRGSMRLRMLNTNANMVIFPTATGAASTNTYTPGDGVHVADTAAQVAAEVPFYSRSAYSPTHACNTITSLLTFQEMPALAQFSNLSGGNVDAMIAFGDDAAYYHVLSPFVFAGGRQEKSQNVIRNGLSIASRKTYEPPETIIGMKVGVTTRKT